MLKAENRIGKRKEFEEVMASGRMLSTPLLGFKYLVKNDEEKRLGIIVSKKISKKAVVRNKIRRRWYEAVAKMLSELPVGLRGVALVKKTIIDKKTEEIGIEAKAMFGKLK